MQKKEPYRTRKVSVRLFLKAGMFFAVVWKVAHCAFYRLHRPEAPQGSTSPFEETGSPTSWESTVPWNCLSSVASI